MYENHFGLKKRPFRASASGTDVFVGPQAAKTMSGIKKALSADDAVVTVSGPVGIGKTTLVNAMAGWADLLPSDVTGTEMLYTEGGENVFRFDEGPIFANLVLADEVLTPDSSRFWPADQYRPGSSPPSYDKQFVRDYLETLDWNKQAPGPNLPPEIITKTAEKYREALTLLTG